MQAYVQFESHLPGDNTAGLRASVASSTPSRSSLFQQQRTAMLGDPALSPKLSVPLLLIHPEPLPTRDSSAPVAPSEFLKVAVSRGQSGHFETVWHNKWKCPISASRHEVYSCHWCHQIKFTRESQSCQSLPFPCL